MATVDIELSWTQLEILKKLIFIVDVAKGKEILRGAGYSNDDKVEWQPEKIEFLIA